MRSWRGLPGCLTFPRRAGPFSPCITRRCRRSLTSPSPSSCVEQHRLADVLEGTDVRAILAGHLHYSSFGTFAGIPVSVASSTCYTQDLAFEQAGTRGHDAAQAFSLVHVYPETVMHSVVPVESGPTAGETVTARQARARLERAGIVIPDAPQVPRELDRAVSGARDRQLNT